MCIWCVIDWWISGCFGLKPLPSLHHSPARNPFPQICSLREQDLHCWLRANRLGLLQHHIVTVILVLESKAVCLVHLWSGVALYLFIYYSFSTNVWPHMHNDAFYPVANCATCCGTQIISLQTMQETVHQIDVKRLRKQVCADSSMKFSRSCSACYLPLCEMMERIAWSTGHFAVLEEWTGGTPSCLNRNRNLQSHSSYLILVYEVYRLWRRIRKEVPGAAYWVARRNRERDGCNINIRFILFELNSFIKKIVYIIKMNWISLIL